MVIYIYGEDGFRSRQYLIDQVEKFKQARDPQGYNVVFLDAQKIEASRILSEIFAVPFLAEKRMIVVENILSISDKDFLADLVERLKNKKIPDSNVVVFYQSEKLGKVKEVKELEAVLKSEKFVQNFESLSGADLINFINTEIKKRGGKISGVATGFLANNLNGDMWLLSSVLDQLVAYCQNEEIGQKEVALFVDEKIDDNAFNMIEAIVNGNKKQAYKLLSEQRRIGEDDFKIFGLLVWQFRILLSLRSLYDEQDSLGSDMAAKILGLHPFVVKKNLALVKKYNKKQLAKIYDQLLYMDLSAKTGQADLGVNIDLLISKI